MDFSYKFPAVKGVQAGKEYYIAMVPLKYLIKILAMTRNMFCPSIARKEK